MDEQFGAESLGAASLGAASLGAESLGAESLGAVLAITPDGNTVYAAPAWPRDVAVPVDTATGQVGKPIRTGKSPVAMTFAADGTIAFVAKPASDTVTLIHTATGRLGGTDPSGDRDAAGRRDRPSPGAILITP